MGWLDVGYMGSTFYQSPNIDKLANEGMIFTNGYAAAANCAPSRASLMTGQWPSRHGIYTVNSSERGKPESRKLVPIKNTTRLAESFEILPEILEENGYTTCHAGKWHLSDDPTSYGFTVNIGGGSNGHPGSYYPPYKNVAIDQGKNEHLTDLIMEKTLEFLDSTDQPFFLNYSPYAIHTPIQPIEALLGKYKDSDNPDNQYNIAYATMIENLDRNIGLLISRLKEKGLFSNTLIIFTSDNGGLYGITRQPPLRAGKGSYYEGGIRVPFFFVWEGKIMGDNQSDIPITNLDLLPTMLDVLKIDKERYSLDGASLLPILSKEVNEMERALFWHFPVYLQAYKNDETQNRDPLFRTRPGSAVRYGEWKLHYYFEDNEVELFNLKEDIGERTNLAASNPAKTEEMLSLLRSYWEKTDSPLPTELNPDYLKNQ
jgi:arylsulfatase A-like enzyme